MSEKQNDTSTKRIRIQCVEKVYFDQIVEIPADEWEQLQGTPRRRMEDGQMSPISNYVNLADPCDSHGFDDVEIFECDEEGKYIDDGEEWDPYTQPTP